MLSLKIAQRYLISRKSHAAVNIISYVSIAGIALAVGAMIIVLSVFNGFAAYTVEQVSGMEAELTLMPAGGKTIARADSLTEVIGQIDGVGEVSQVVTERALAIAGDQQMPVRIIGVRPGSQEEARTGAHLIDGEAYIGEAYDRQWAILSVGVANRLLTTPASPWPVRLYEPRRKGRISAANPARAFRADSVYVAGVIRTDVADYDEDVIVVDIELAKRLCAYDNEASYLAVSLNDRAAVERIKETAGEGIVLMNPVERHAEAFKMINIEKWVTLLMLTFILIIAAFNLLSTMAMLLQEKRANMASMRAMGASSNLTGSVYKWLTMLITLGGTAAGVILGCGLTLSQQLWGWFKMQVDNPDMLTITAYPVRLNAIDVMIIVAIATVIGYVAALIVGRAARRLAVEPSRG